MLNDPNSSTGQSIFFSLTLLLLFLGGVVSLFLDDGCIRPLKSNFRVCGIEAKIGVGLLGVIALYSLKSLKKNPKNTGSPD